MNSVLRWVPPKRALIDAIAMLRRLPIEFAVDDSRSGTFSWYMNIRDHSENAPDRSRGPGIYATAFAVRLLCATNSPAELNKKFAIAGGIRYLFSQMNEAAVAAGQPQRKGTRQATKKKDLGYTDVDLVLKIAQTIEAFNALKSIKDKDDVLSAAFDEFKESAEDLVQKLRDAVIDQEFHGTRRQSWSWHRIANQRRASHVVPTVQAACALLRYDPDNNLVDAQSILHYLDSELKSDPNAILPLRATAYNGIVEIAELTATPVRASPSIDEFLKDLDRVRDSIDDFNWQEVLFYEIPATDTVVTHHKPWIWYSPRLELLRSLLASGEPKRVETGLDSALALAKRVIKKKGLIRFFRTNPGNWVTIFEVSRLLAAAAGRFDGPKKELGVAFRAFRVLASRLLQNHQPLAWGFILFGLWSFATQVGWFSVATSPENNSAHVVLQALRTIFDFLPIAVLVIVATAIGGQGTIEKRLLSATKTVFIALLLHMLAVIGAH